MVRFLSNMYLYLTLFLKVPEQDSSHFVNVSISNKTKAGTNSKKHLTAPPPAKSSTNVAPEVDSWGVKMDTHPIKTKKRVSDEIPLGNLPPIKLLPTVPVKKLAASVVKPKLKPPTHTSTLPIKISAKPSAGMYTRRFWGKGEGERECEGGRGKGGGGGLCLNDWHVFTIITYKENQVK